MWIRTRRSNLELRWRAEGRAVMGGPLCVASPKAGPFLISRKVPAQRDRGEGLGDLYRPDLTKSRLLKKRVTDPFGSRNSENFPWVELMCTGRLACAIYKESKHMDKDRIKGKVKQLEGKVQEAAGDLTHSNKERVKGAAKVAEGKVQEQFGKAKDAVRKAAK